LYFHIENQSIYKSEEQIKSGLGRLDFDLLVTAAIGLFIVGLAAIMYYESLNPKSRSIEETKSENAREND
jgi:hypothetical protein